MGNGASSPEGNRGWSRRRSSTTSRSVSDSSMSRDPSLSSSLEVAPNVEIPIHESIDRDSSALFDGPPIYDSNPRGSFIPISFIYNSYRSGSFGEDDESMVTEALRKGGLNSCNLIVAIDFTASNERTGKGSFNNQSLHAIGDTLNPYEKVISIIGKNLASFNEDKSIHCFGFGDELATTHDQVFSFQSVDSPCQNFEEVGLCYKKIAPNVRLSEPPTSYASVIEAAIDIVEKSGGKYHVLLIISNGQATRSVNTSDTELSPQEEQTIKSIGNASSYPLSIVLVGVGDGPWHHMTKFEDKLRAHTFKNFQFVNFTEMMHESKAGEKETAFALAALTGLPFQYKEAMNLNMLGRVTGRAKKIIPRPPPVPQPAWEPSSNLPSSVGDERDQMTCPICLTNANDLAFNCGHLTCKECGSKVSNCPICRQPIRSRLRLFTG